MNSQIEKLQKAAADVEEAAKKFDALETGLSVAYCREAGRKVEMLEAALDEVRRIVEQRPHLLNNGYYAVSVPTYYALEQGKEARLQLTVYLPHCHSVAERYLRQRRKVARSYRAFAETVSDVVKAMSATMPTQSPQPQRRRERPAYLRLIVPAVESQGGPQA